LEKKKKERSHGDRQKFWGKDDAPDELRTGGEEAELKGNRNRRLRNRGAL